jgi:hypothetical protein
MLHGVLQQLACCADATSASLHATMHGASITAQRAVRRLTRSRRLCRRSCSSMRSIRSVKIPQAYSCMLRRVSCMLRRVCCVARCMLRCMLSVALHVACCSARCMLHVTLLFSAIGLVKVSAGGATHRAMARCALQRSSSVSGRGADEPVGVCGAHERLLLQVDDGRSEELYAVAPRCCMCKPLLYPVASCVLAEHTGRSLPSASE